MNSTRRQRDQGDGTFVEETVSNSSSEKVQRLESSEEPISNAERYADYLDKRRASILAMSLETEEAVRKLKKEGVSEESARKAVKEALSKNRDPQRIKAADIKDKQGSLLKTYATRSVKIGFFPILAGFICFLMFFLTAFTAVAISQPSRFLSLECAETLLGSKEKAIDCIRQTYQQNNQKSFENQGLTI